MGGSRIDMGSEKGVIMDYGRMSDAVIISDCVCPICIKPLNVANFIYQGEDEYGRTVRAYYGACNCRNDIFEVVQFRVGDRWLINKYRTFEKDEDGKNRPAEDWQTVTELPNAPLLLLGPGGEFTVPVDFENNERHPLQSLATALESTLKLIREIINHA